MQTISHARWIARAAATASLLLLGPVHAADDPGGQLCRAPSIAVIARALDLEPGSLLAQEFATTMAASAPENLTPSNANTTADADSGGAPSAADLASRARVLALATNAGLVERKGGTVTVSITPFAWIALLDPEVLEDQREYTRFDAWRRWSGKVTLGGTGDAFDRDGDGTVDDGLPAESLGDIASYELSVRLVGSRDRRDIGNWAAFERVSAASEAALLDDFSDLNRAYSQALARVVARRTERQQSVAPADWNGEACNELVKELRSNNAEVLRLATAAARVQESARSASRAWAAITDTAFVMSLVASGTERRPAFGGDRQLVGLRAGWGFVPAPLAEGKDVCAACSTGQSLDVSLDYVRNELPTGRDELEGARLGLRWQAKFREFPGFGWKDATLSLDAAAEKFSDVPAGLPDNVAKASAGVSFKVSDTLKVPFSITWANRSSLLGEQDEVIGHIGISYDLDALFDGRAK